MKTLLAVSLLTVSLLTLNATVAQASGKKSSTPDLTGSWASASCESVPNGQGGTMYFTRTFAITHDTWSIDFAVFGDAACSEPQRLFTATYAGPYRLLGPSKRVPGATEAEFDFASRSVKPASAGGAGYFNSQKMCGASDWKVGEAKDILEAGCPALGAWPHAQCKGEHDVVKVAGDELFFGQRPADQNLCSDAKRPAALDATPVKRK